ncbi:hypothetical protein IT398_00750 [Candidatus Nomurabacteria bacterium]|nr:hypothetical protein [Candidatus Nomurabacteria bacterium]
MIKSGQLKNITDSPGVYLFKRGQEILYIGRATSLRNRVRSYFGRGLAETRGEWLVKMVNEATRVETRPTDSVLEALILEAVLIKKHQPKHNAKEKDGKTFWYVVITEEKWPRILLVRGSNLEKYLTSAVFGPFPYSTEIKTALKIIRKIFPFRDKCKPGGSRPCFNYQIGLCPGVCAGLVSETDYRKLVKQIGLFFSGKKRQLLQSLDSEMKRLARKQMFEGAGKIKKQLFALQHIQDVALIKSEGISSESGQGLFRLEAYDVAHLGGQNTVGVMVVLENGEMVRDKYRKFKLRTSKAGDDLGALREILGRRLNHPEWPFPNLIVIDGGKNQLKVAENTLLENGLEQMALVSVVKDDKHRAREILGDKTAGKKYEAEIIRANHEAHRFAISYHRQKRRRALF